VQDVKCRNLVERSGNHLQSSSKKKRPNLLEASILASDFLRKKRRDDAKGRRVFITKGMDGKHCPFARVKPCHPAIPSLFQSPFCLLRQQMWGSFGETTFGHGQSCQVLEAKVLRLCQVLAGGLFQSPLAGGKPPHKANRTT